MRVIIKKKDRVILAISSNLKNSLFRRKDIFFALSVVGSLDVLPDTPSLAAIRNHRKILVFKARSVFAVKMTR